MKLSQRMLTIQTSWRQDTDAYDATGRDRLAPGIGQDSTDPTYGNYGRRRRRLIYLEESSKKLSRGKGVSYPTKTKLHKCEAEGEICIKALKYWTLTHPWLVPRISRVPIIGECGDRRGCCSSICALLTQIRTASFLPKYLSLLASWPFVVR